MVAVAPRTELRPFIQDRLYVKRVPKGWAIDAAGSVDYDAPDDWTVSFVQSLDDAVGLARSEGFEPVLATPLIRRFVPYSLEAHIPAWVATTPPPKLVPMVSRDLAAV